MHTMIHATAVYASLSAIFWAAVFIAYLEIYTWVTKDEMTNYDPFSLRVLVPKLAFYVTVYSAAVSVCATAAEYFGL